MKISLHLIPSEIQKQYNANFNETTQERFEHLTDSELSIEGFSFYTSVSAVFSSKIEGVDIELDSYLQHKRFGKKYLPDYTRKIDDLYDAYAFAKQTKLSGKSLEQAHKKLTAHILQKSQQGKIRTGNMFVVTDEGKIEYVATSGDKVKSEVKKYYSDIETLLNLELTFKEVLFFASMLHLVFVKIHPFEDGNGRAGRLLEKWFIAEKLGPKAWFIQSEKYYYEQHDMYYHNIRRLGLEYEELNYSESLPFLQMLPNSI
ncbi:MAG: Fic family protein [Saprospiraceae bacterium]